MQNLPALGLGYDRTKRCTGVVLRRAFASLINDFSRPRDL